jgi:hypothetical protein
MHQLSRTHGADARFTASLPHAQPMLQVCVPGSAEWTPRCQVDARRADLGQASQAAAAAPAATTPTTAGTGGALNSDDDGDDDDEDSDNDSGGDSDGVDEPGYDDDFDADGDNIRLEAPCDLDDDEQAIYDLEQEIIEHFDDDS